MSENTLILGQITSPLYKYSSEFLDSLFLKARTETKIVITDTMTNQRFEFLPCEKGLKTKEKPWFKNIPEWLFFTVNVPTDSPGVK